MNLFVHAHRHTAHTERSSPHWFRAMCKKKSCQCIVCLSQFSSLVLFPAKYRNFCARRSSKTHKNTISFSIRMEAGDGVYCVHIRPIHQHTTTYVLMQMQNNKFPSLIFAPNEMRAIVRWYCFFSRLCSYVSFVISTSFVRYLSISVCLSVARGRWMAQVLVVRRVYFVLPAIAHTHTVHNDAHISRDQTRYCIFAFRMKWRMTNLRRDTTNSYFGTVFFFGMNKIIIYLTWTDSFSIFFANTFDQQNIYTLPFLHRFDTFLFLFLQIHSN